MLVRAFSYNLSLVALPVSAVSQLARQDYKNEYFRGRFMII